MGSKLRPLYDKLYIKTETALLAWSAAKENRRYAASVTPPPALDRDYNSVVRPYWRQFRVRTPKKYSFRLFGNADQGPDARVDPRYIPDDLWFGRIIPHYNNLIFAKALQDKGMFSLLFPEIRQPETLVKNSAGVYYDENWALLTPEQAFRHCVGHGRVIVKPTIYTGQGHNIRFFDSDALSPQEIGTILASYGSNFIVQKKLEQHPALASLNASSVNSIRVITMLRDDGVHVLTACLRVGGSESEIDNCSQGGFAYTIRPDGTLTNRGFSHSDRQWFYTDTLPTGAPIDQFSIPSYDRIIDAVSKLAARMGHFRIIGWDISVAPDGEPVFIEFNVIPGQNQECDGPTFGDLTDRILEEVFGRRA